MINITKKLAEAYTKVNENQKAVMEAVFVIPEEIPAQERTAFHGAAAAAHKAGKSHFSFNGKKHPVTMKKDAAHAITSDTQKEAADLDKGNADKAIKHDCATHVEHAKWGPGQPISGEHTIVETSPGHGYVTHYDVLFEHGLEKDVSVEDLKILKESHHGHARKKKSTTEDEVVMNPKKEKKKGNEKNTDMDKEATPMESTIYKRILEARATADKDGKHTKGATPPEEMDSKDSPSAKKMRADHKGDVIDNPEASGDEVRKASDAGPKSPARKGDNMKGDKKIIPSATPVKGM
tara:strand:+ start:2848 stop:3726 length:879 start_codon:yes stop_codon:yes gene_type:complete